MMSNYDGEGPNDNDNDNDKTKLPDNVVTHPMASPSLSAAEQFEKLKQANASPFGDFIRLDFMGKTLFAMYGEEKTLIQPNSIWAVNPGSLQAGFITWAKKEPGSKSSGGPLEELMKPSGAGAPYTWDDCQDFPNSRTSQQNSFALKGVSPDDKNQLCVYKTSSMPGRQAVMDLWAWFSSIIGDRPISGFVPMVHLDPQFENNKKYGGMSKFLAFKPLGVYTSEDAAAILEQGSVEGFESVDASSQH